MPKHIAILGGGVAGMSAAHELIQRGFQVTVFEKGTIPGGKARSLSWDGTGQEGRKDLPGEHGFRFFPGFYKHLPETMKCIRVGNDTAYDHLVTTHATQLAREGGEQNLYTPNQFPTSLGAMVQAFQAFTLFYCDLGIPKSEVTHFVRKLITMLVSGNTRRYESYESTSWKDFIDAGAMSDAYDRYLATGLSRSLVALNADKLSSRTAGVILLQFLLDFTGFQPLDRVLDLPTNEAWIDPWLDQLRSAGVAYHLNAPVEDIRCRDGRICNVKVKIDGKLQDFEADYYIGAVPVEVMRCQLTPEMLDADPSLNDLYDLCVSWMTGVIFYLNEDVRPVRGHSNYLDSEWALTSISQPQFWPTVDLTQYGNGNVRGILSVIISNWDDPLFNGGRAAKECDEDQVKEIVWEQLKDHLNSPGRTVLRDDQKECVFLAPCMVYNSVTEQWDNDEPLLINTVDSWWKRPQAKTAIDNFFLASDYVRTNTDLATMESANEAARRAVNGILELERSHHPRCKIWPLEEPSLLAGYKFLDEIRYRKGKAPLVPPIPVLPWPCP